MSINLTPLDELSAEIIAALNQQYEALKDQYAPDFTTIKAKDGQDNELDDKAEWKEF